MFEYRCRCSPLPRFIRVTSQSLLSLVVLFVLIGHCQSVRAQVPAITEVTPNVVPPDGIFRLTFSADITARSIKIGNLDGSFVSSPTATKTIEVKVPAGIALGPHPVSVFLDETRAITTAITVATASAKIIEVKPNIAQPGGTIFLTFNKQLKPDSVKVGIGNIDATFVSETTHRLEVVLPTTVTSGRQTITVTTTPNQPEPIVGSIMVARKA